MSKEERMTTITPEVVTDLRALLAGLIRDECDLHCTSEAELPALNRAFLNGARRLVERAEHVAGLPHAYITAADASPRPTVYTAPAPRPRIAGALGMMASSRSATQDFDLPPGTKWDQVRDDTGHYEWTIVPA